MTRQIASLVEWKDDKGYGFARLAGGTERIFVHMKALEPDSPRPKKGDELELEVIAGRNGKPAGQNVRVLNDADAARQLPYHVITAAMLFILAQLAVITQRAPLELLLVYVMMSLISLVLYSRDKQAARDGFWRISEIRLLTVDLLGGVVGGLLAQHRYRHKKSKESYQLRTFSIVVIHAVFLAALGSGFLTLPHWGTYLS